MTEGLSANPTLSPGYEARIRCVSLLLARQELATIADVSQDDVDMLEGMIPA